MMKSLAIGDVSVRMLLRGIIKNNVTIARGEWGGDSGERGLQELL